MRSIKPFEYSQAINGAQVKPLIDSGRNVSIRYNGLLSVSGAADIFLHYGLGEPDSWQEISDLEMGKTPDGWETVVSVHDKQLNFCFRDGASNWDNNNGYNWIYRIS
jgi:hypothetical protein